MLIESTMSIQADIVLTPIAAYNVDILHGRSAEAFAVTRSVPTVGSLSRG
jgi:hypothetical protein